MNKLKLPFTFLLILLTIGVSYGQSGVRAGVNLASLRMKTDFFGSSFSITTDDKLGGQFGVYYRTTINEKFSIRPNLVFTTGGGTIKDETSGESNSVSSSYLGLPIDFLYTVPAGSNTLSLVGGPFLGYLLSSSSEQGTGEDEFSSLDYGLHFGLQYHIKSFGIGLSYSWGMANVIPEEVTGDPFFEGFTAQTRAISLYFTYDL
jgi:hypothetical protein